MTKREIIEWVISYVDFCNDKQYHKILTKDESDEVYGWLEEQYNAAKNAEQ